LKRFAEETGDTTESPFRVDVVARYGGKPPLYTVVIRCAEKEPIRHKLGTCGGLKLEQCVLMHVTPITSVSAQDKSAHSLNGRALSFLQRRIARSHQSLHPPQSDEGCE